MVITDFGFASTRNWLIGQSITAPSGMLTGTGSALPTFADLLLGSPMDPTRHPFASKSGIGTTVIQFEHLVDSGDITTGSLVHEIGLINASGASVWFKDGLPEIQLSGSTLIDSFLILNVR